MHFIIIAWLGIAWIGPGEPPQVAAATITFTGMETLADAIKLLQSTGNSVVDGRAERGQEPTNPLLNLKPGRRTFWEAVEEINKQGQLSIEWRNQQLHFITRESPMLPTAKEGPFCVALRRSSVISYFDHPVNDRLVFQVEMMCEPRLHPLLFRLPSTGVSWEPTLPSIARPGSWSYRFDGEKQTLLELKMPRPDRSLAKLAKLAMAGTVWVSTDRLQFQLPLKVGAAAEQKQTKCTIIRVEENGASKTWEVVVKIAYPEASLDWESNQSGLLGQMTMALTNDARQRIPAVGNEVRTDQGRTIEARWQLRNVPGQPLDWRAMIQAPSVPVACPLNVTFRDIPLP